MTPVFAVSETTQKLLKNFAGINPQTLLREGKSQRVCPKTLSVLALAEFSEAWPKETAIFDLPKFLGVLSTFAKPGIEFHDEEMNVRDVHDAEKFVRWQYSDPSLMMNETRTPSLENPALEFSLSETTFSQLRKLASQLDLSAVVFKQDGSKVTMTAMDPDNPRSHKFEVQVSPEDMTLNTNEFSSLTLNIEHVQMLIDGAYTVKLGTWAYAHFTHKTLPVSYFIAKKKDM